MQKMTRREMHEWKRRTVRYKQHRRPREDDALIAQKVIACCILALMVAAMLVSCAAAGKEYAKASRAACAADTMVLYPWATVSRNASLHEGPDYTCRMAGMARVGTAVQVIWQQDGWSKAWVPGHAQPVWVSDGHLTF